VTVERRLGLELAGNLSIRDKVEMARWAEARGYQDAWVAEISDPDVFVTLGLIAQGTSRIRIGTGIVPMGPRSVPVLASAAASLADVSDDRFVLGLGVSSDVIVQDWNGVVRGKPLGRSRETVELLRHLLAGGRSDHHGDWVRSKGFRLRMPSAQPPPIVLAALNEKMLELAGEIADGVFLNFMPVTAAERAVEAVRRGAERAGRDELPELILFVPAQVTDDAEAAIAAFGHGLAFYLTAPPYQKALSWYGFEDEIERAKQAWASGGIEGVRAVITPELVSAIGTFGSYETCRERFEQFWDAGIGTLAITVPTGADQLATLEPFAALAETLAAAA
jgi:probable F420-dependent oxidoreductase